MQHPITILRLYRTMFGDSAADVKLLALQHLNKNFKPAFSQLQELHELLLFIRTYPDNPAVLEAAAKALDKLVIHLKSVRRKNPEKFIKAFYNSGIAHSTVHNAPSVDLAEWLCSHYATQLSDVTGPDHLDRIGPLLALLASAPEQNGLEHESYDGHDWLKMAKGKRSTFLSWLASRTMAAISEEYVRDQIFETAQPEAEWILSDTRASRTCNTIEGGEIVFQNEPIRKSDYMSLIMEPMEPPRPVKGARATTLLDSMKAVLTVRSRETDPVTYASGVYEAVPYPGLSVYLTVMRPSRKLPLENYTGYVAYRNGVPVAYGGGWMFGRRCEIGLNVFETFRGGENTRLFAGLIKVYRNLCQAARFVVQPYQFGADNEEGLNSGAFWFYYRMGFRPQDAATARLATAAFNRLRSGKVKKTPLALLRKFAEHPVELVISTDPYTAEPKEISIAITKKFAADFNGDTSAGMQWATKQATGILGGRLSERTTAISTWAPVLALMKDASRWNNRQRSIAKEIIQCKHTDELKFTRLMAAHDFFRKSLWSITRKGS